MKFPSTEFEQALSDLCHGTIEDQAIDGLHTLLQQDADARDAYLWRIELHGELSAGRLDFATPSGPESPQEAGLVKSAVVTAPPLHPNVLSGWRGLRFRKALVAMAAVVLVVLGYGFKRMATDPPMQQLAERPLDPFLAIVVDESHDVAWEGVGPDWGLGHALGRQRAHLESGDATLQLHNGVELMLRGPTELQLLSVDHAILQRGQVSARVPEGAIGFRLDAPGLNVVDLGTEFSLAVDDAGASSVHVFEGKVRAALPSLPSSRTELLTGETAQFDADKGEVTRRLSDVSLFPPLNDDAGLPKTEGDICFLRKPPPSLHPGTFEHDSILVFREKDNVALPRRLRVVRKVSHQFRSKQPSVPETVDLAAHTPVQSYLIHFDRVGDSWTGGVTARGVIRFDQPILGLVIEPERLSETDLFCCHEDTDYVKGITRPLEMRFISDAPNGHDEVYLTDDGHELELTLRAGPYVDQFRVLVEVPTE